MAIIGLAVDDRQGVNMSEQATRRIALYYCTLQARTVNY